jgi:hypothetical protein
VDCLCDQHAAEIRHKLPAPHLGAAKSTTRVRKPLPEGAAFRRTSDREEGRSSCGGAAGLMPLFARRRAVSPGTVQRWSPQYAGSRLDRYGEDSSDDYLEFVWFHDAAPTGRRRSDDRSRRFFK